MSYIKRRLKLRKEIKQIEIYFKILKSGCKIEKLQINDDTRFRPCLALYMIIAWRILYMTMLGRECPDVNCEIVFDKIEWQTAYIVLKHEKPPKDPPPLKEIIKLIASLGGFLNRSGDNKPGPSALWKGVRALYEQVKAREAFELVFGCQWPLKVYQNWPIKLCHLRQKNYSFCDLYF